MSEIQDIYADETVKITFIESDVESENVVIAFAGVGNKFGVIDLQAEEFKNSVQYGSVVFIMDQKRSWGNDLDFNLIKEKIADKIAGKKVYIMGNSMGGFLAVLASKFIPADTVVAFAAPFSIKYSVISDDDRVHEQALRVEEWKHESLEGCFMENTKYYVFHDLDEPREQYHIDKYPVLSNVKHIVTDNGYGHHYAAGLKAKGNLYTVITKCVNGEDKDSIKAVCEL